MDMTAANLERLFTGLKTAFNAGFAGVQGDWKKFAFEVPSSTSGEAYAWMNDLPKMREWIGPRVLKRLSEQTYSIPNKTWEDSVRVPRARIEDDQYGIYARLAEELGRAAAEHPAELIYRLLEGGFETPCYDGQNFFDADHPVIDPQTGQETSVSNMQDGAHKPWFVIDNTRVIRPIVFQNRRTAEFNRLTDPKQSEHVFMNDEFVYGADARYNTGFSLWQLAFGSKAELTRESLRAAIDAMKRLKSDEGRLLGIRPKLLIVGIGNAHIARELIKAERLDGGASNVDANIVEIHEAPFLE